MSSLQNQVKKLKYDRRLLNAAVKNGELSKEELEKYMKSLEDCSDRAKSVKISSAAAESIN
jgi:exopolyphosphatase/pppGpp-phosphohydrolase